MTDTITTPPVFDDPITAQLMEAINEARILLGSHEHRQDLAEMAKISNDMIRLDERRTELQAAIDARNKVYLAAEEALGAHLMTKHRVVAPNPENAATDDPGALPVKVRPRVDDHHASNCSIFFDEPCDCQ